MRIRNDVMAILRGARCENHTVIIEEQDRDREAALERVMRAAGAQVNPSTMRFEFPDLYPSGDAGALIAAMVATGHTVRPPSRGIVSCPPMAAREMVGRIREDFGRDTTVLEPSAGHGTLAAHAAAVGLDVHCIEINPLAAADIRRARIGDAEIASQVQVADFLMMGPKPVYEAVLMYPPFPRAQAVQHILQGYRFLAPGGVLVALIHPTFLGPHHYHPASDELWRLWQERGGTRTGLPERTVHAPNGRPVDADMVILSAPE